MFITNNKNVKIHYIVNARIPTERAHGIQLAKMCEAFVDHGVDLTLVAPKRKNAIKETMESFYGLKNKIKIKKIPVIDLYNSGKLGFRISSVSFAISYFLYMLGLKLKRKGGIIYTIDMDQFSFFAIPMLGMPYFTEMHDIKKKSFCHKFFLKKINGAITINELIKKEITDKFNLENGKVIVQPNSIDFNNFLGVLDKIESRKKLGLSLDKKIILYVGKFYDWKGLGILISLAEKMKDHLIYLVGDREEELVKICGADKIPANLLCQGHRDFKEMPLWQSSADVLVLLGTKGNDYSWYYTSPMKLFEYMAARRPIVASRTPAIEQIVSDSGVFFYEPDNVDDLVNQTKRALQNNKETEEKIEEAYQRVKSFSWDKRAESILEFIKLNK